MKTYSIVTESGTIASNLCLEQAVKIYEELRVHMVEPGMWQQIVGNDDMVYAGAEYSPAPQTTLYSTISGDVISAKTLEQAERHASRHGCGPVLGVADTATLSRRHAAYLATDEGARGRT